MLYNEYLLNKAYLIGAACTLESDYNKHIRNGTDKYHLILTGVDEYTITDATKDDRPIAIVTRIRIPPEPGIFFGLIGSTPGVTEYDHIFQLRAIEVCNKLNIEHTDNMDKYPSRVRLE